MSPPATEADPFCQFYPGADRVKFHSRDSLRRGVRPPKQALTYVGCEWRMANGNGCLALQLLGSLLPQTPSFSWGFSPPRTGRGGWRLEWLFGSPVAGESAYANSFLGVGLLTAAPKREP